MYSMHTKYEVSVMVQVIQYHFNFFFLEGGGGTC